MQDYSTGYESRIALQEGWEKWVMSLADWQHFVTLTFKDFQTRDQAEHAFRFLLRVLNTDLFGKHYTRTVGHCYCSYVVGFEKQTRGALHMHVLFDRPINFNLIHRIWCGDPKNPRFGFAFIKPVEDAQGAVEYISKYISKDGDLMLYKPTQVKQPPFQPYWFDVAMLDVNRLFK